MDRTPRRLAGAFALIALLAAFTLWLPLQRAALPPPPGPQAPPRDSDPAPALQREELTALREDAPQPASPKAAPSLPTLPPMPHPQLAIDGVPDDVCAAMLKAAEVHWQMLQRQEYVLRQNPEKAPTALDRDERFFFAIWPNLQALVEQKRVVDFTVSRPQYPTGIKGAGAITYSIDLDRPTLGVAFHTSTASVSFTVLDSLGHDELWAALHAAHARQATK